MKILGLCKKTRISGCHFFQLMSSLSHCWQIKKQLRVRLKSALTLQYFLKYERNPVLWKRVVVPYYFAHNRLPCWPHVPYYNTMDAWKSCMWNPRNIPVWLLGSKLEWVFVHSEAAFYPAWGRNTQGQAKSYFGLSEVITMHLWFSHLIMQCYLDKKKSSWAPADDCQVLCMMIQEFSILLPLRAT